MFQPGLEQLQFGQGVAVRLRRRAMAGILPTLRALPEVVLSLLGGLGQSFKDEERRLRRGGGTFGHVLSLPGAGVHGDGHLLAQELESGPVEGVAVGAGLSVVMACGFPCTEFGVGDGPKPLLGSGQGPGGRFCGHPRKPFLCEANHQQVGGAIVYGP